MTKKERKENKNNNKNPPLLKSGRASSQAIYSTKSDTSNSACQIFRLWSHAQNQTTLSLLLLYIYIIIIIMTFLHLLLELLTHVCQLSSSFVLISLLGLLYAF